MLFLTLLAVIGLLAIAVTVRAVFTDGYAPIRTRFDDGFDPDSRHTPLVKGNA